MGADFRRFRIGGYSNDFAARGDAARARGSPAVPRWGFFQFLCRARRRDAGARVSGGSALGFLPVPLPREVTRRRRAGLRRFRIGVSSGSFAARGGATQARGSAAVPHWGFFRFLCRARRRDAGARVSGGSALGFLPVPLPREVTRRRRAGLRRFRIGVSSGSFAARSDADARVSGGFALAVSRNFAARSDANARVSGGFALAILPALLAHEARRFHVREVIPALSRTRRCGRGRG